MTRRPHTAYAGSTSPGFEWKTEPSWDDLQGSVVEGAAGAALTFAAFRDTPFKLASFRDNQSDELHMVYQMSHRWAPGTELHPHIHVIPLTDPAANEVVLFEGQYLFVGHGEEVAANAGWETFSVEYVVEPGSVNKIRIVGLPRLTPPESSAESDMLLIYVKRSGTDVADTYAGDLAALSVDCHIQAEKVGTIEEFLGAQP